MRCGGVVVARIINHERNTQKISPLAPAVPPPVSAELPQYTVSTLLAFLVSFALLALTSLSATHDRRSARRTRPIER